MIRIFFTAETQSHGSFAEARCVPLGFVLSAPLR